MMISLRLQNPTLSVNCFIGLYSLVLVFLCGTAFAQEIAENKADKDKAKTEEKLTEYGGVVVDQTLTGFGRFFYINFSLGWSDKANSVDYVMSIKERPSPRGGTEVWVMANELVVFRSSLPRSYAAVSSLSGTAVEQADAQLTQMRIQAAIFTNNDLASSGL